MNTAILILSNAHDDVNNEKNTVKFSIIIENKNIKCYSVKVSNNYRVFVQRKLRYHNF